MLVLTLNPKPISVGFESWWCDLGVLKEGRSGEEERILKPIVLRRKRSYRYFVVETTYFVLVYHKFLFVFLFHFNKTWNSIVSLIHVFNNTMKHKILQWILCSYHYVNFLYYHNMMKWIVFLFLESLIMYSKV
jgi:hypothetical protein